MTEPEISVILTCHREGVLLGPTVKSCIEAIKVARQNDISLEVLVVQDNCDQLTESMLPSDSVAETFGVAAKVYRTRYGDPGLSRNHGVRESKGRFVTFLDGDDLWGSNWLSACRKFHSTLDKRAVLHSDINIVFGKSRLIWVHPSSLDRDLTFKELLLFNYWDAMAFGERKMYIEHPYVPNDLMRGYGHEDWHWACETIGAGIHHIPVPDTVHFKRSRSHSQMALCDTADVIVRDNSLIPIEGILSAKARLGLI